MSMHWIWPLKLTKPLRSSAMASRPTVNVRNPSGGTYRLSLLFITGLIIRFVDSRGPCLPPTPSGFDRSHQARCCPTSSQYVLMSYFELLKFWRLLQRALRKIKGKLMPWAWRLVTRPALSPGVLVAPSLEFPVLVAVELTVLDRYVLKLTFFTPKIWSIIWTSGCLR